ncbi:MAG: Histone deacetylase-like amidohydrolase [Chroococcopsis gigantea SAG 12.99]|jgi:acetoin utilization deacetylase AcuC-like enzyme|nr:histone deacetylase [Chlorogloea purpurea SAG 13.99]MDV3000744.1 Histone deacetylase-like amidohydrolase [Chroococcopsis gigantea SAG 12.99]
MISIIYSDEFLNHDTGSFHPERPERLTAIVSALKSASWTQQLQWQKPTPVEFRDEVMGLIEEVHSSDYLQHIKHLSAKGGGMLDGDTPVSKYSYDVATLAVSAWLDGIDRTLATGNPSFILARPPGHHACKNHGMGFCLFSNAAIAAYYALQEKAINRVAILDWDVHHGNGTQERVENNSRIAYCSLHQSPCYPGTGTRQERGLHHNVLNIPLSPGSNVSVYKSAFIGEVLPFLQGFKPDLLIVSAGYDATAADMLATMNLQPEDYGLFTEYIRTLGCPILFGLEGGYDLDALSASVVATLEVFTRS